MHFWPEVSFVGFTCSVAGDAERLAWVPSGEKIECAEFGALERANVVMFWYLRPVFI